MPPAAPGNNGGSDPLKIEDELKDSYLSYAMSVIIAPFPMPATDSSRRNAASSWRCTI